MPRDNAPSLSDQTEWLQLGPNTYEVGAQPIPIVKHALADYFARLTASDIDVENFLEFATGKAHELLSIFIPDLMPLYEWEGYLSADAMARGEFDPDVARRVAPDGQQVHHALVVCFKVNKLDIHKLLGKIVDPTVLREWVTRQVRDYLSRTSLSELSEPAPTPSTISSPPESPIAGDGATDEEFFANPDADDLAPTV